jgi:ligand-binding SRPBCC domain-containing protein
MTVLENEIVIDAPVADVWAQLAALDELDRYDPGVKRSLIVSDVREGLHATRRCDLPKGWFEEKVIDWKPGESLAFELTRCSLPVSSLTHRYTFVANGDRTIVRQRMEYRLKMGPVGAAMDALVVRRKWDGGIKAFLAGLKDRVESSRKASQPGK